MAANEKYINGAIRVSTSGHTPPMKSIESAADLVDWAEARLKRSPAIDHWPADRERREATALLSFALGDHEASEEFARPDESVPARTRERYRRLVDRRATGEPMAYILGWTTFRGLRMAVRPGAFVPRQSSELLADGAVRRLRGRRKPVAIDLATGIGPVALAVADAVSGADVHGTDISPEAVRQARANAASLGLRNAAFHRGDLFDSIPARLRGRVDVITVHPPYIPRREVVDLPVEIRGFEPKESLTDRSADGLGLLERTAEEAPEWLRSGGWLLVEVSPDRARHVRSRLVRSGYRDVRSTRGWPNISRVVVGRT
jgi:release factor glutamine methyltransferase